MVVVLGGKDKMPERFWKAFWEKGGANWWFDKQGALLPKGALLPERSYHFKVPTCLEKKIQELRGAHEALGMKDEAVLLRVLETALMYEPKERPTAEEIVSMFPKEWDTARCVPAA
jgi:hypothetical protein